MIRNNFLALLGYISIAVIVTLLCSVSFAVFGNGNPPPLALSFSIPILAAIPILFILVGKYVLKPQISSLADFLSVLLPCLLGLLCTPSIAFYKPQLYGFAVTSIYFAYLEPLSMAAVSLGSNWNYLGVGQGVSGLFLDSLYSVLPVVLMWVGLRWQVRKRDST